MPEIKASIVICGLICLTAIYIAMLVLGHVNGAIGATIVGAIALAIGVVIPSPRADNKTGVLRW